MGDGGWVRDEGGDLVQCGLSLGICIAWGDFRDARSNCILGIGIWSMGLGCALRYFTAFTTTTGLRIADRWMIDLYA